MTSSLPRRSTKTYKSKKIHGYKVTIRYYGPKDDPLWTAEISKDRLKDYVESWSKRDLISEIKRSIKILSKTR